LLHDSMLRLRDARELQVLLSKRVICEDRLPDPVRLVAGVDVAYIAEDSVCAVTVLDYETMNLVEKSTSRQKTRFPYIPGFLSFREVPPAVSAIRKLTLRPDVFLVDGHGYAHPRRLGFASHLGLVLDAPTIGVAKSLLCGEVRNRVDDKWKPVVHEGEIVGRAVFKSSHAKPIYVSVGHKVSLETAVGIVLHCSKEQRIPEPLRQAHSAAIKEREYRRQKVR